MPLAREHDPRVLVVDGDRDIREGLVVAQPHVEWRPVPLDEVLLEVERLHLTLGHDHLNVRHPLRQLPNRRPRIRALLLKIRPHPGSQRLRLPDIQDVASLIPKQINARLSRKPLELILEPCSHSKPA
jgi:hypothetical protein